MAYTVERHGDVIEKSLPLVIGVMANLVGHASESLSPLTDRDFISVDRDNVDSVIEQVAPRLDFSAPSTLDTPDDRLAVSLRFASLADFHPIAVANQIEPLRRLLALRDLLEQLKTAIVTRGESAGDLDPRIDDLKPTLARAIEETSSLLSEDAERPCVEVLRVVEAPGASSRTVAEPMAGAIDALLRLIDEWISRQLTQVMHAADFRGLEGVWRGVAYLVANSETSVTLRLKSLNCSKEELADDLMTAIEPARSDVYQKLWREFTDWDGAPFSALIGDYEFTDSDDDIVLLGRIGDVAAACYCPFLSAASSRLVGFDSWEEMEAKPVGPHELGPRKNSMWESTRRRPQARFVGLCVPPSLARAPYGGDGSSGGGFVYNELPEASCNRPEGPPTSDCCWMNTAYVLGLRLAHSFSRHACGTHIRGVEDGGLVDDLPTSTRVDSEGAAKVLCPTAARFDERVEHAAALGGFIALCNRLGAADCVFFGCETLQRPMKYSNPITTSNSATMARLPYVVAMSRIAHYLMAIARDKSGRFEDLTDAEALLNEWIGQYVTSEKEPSTTLERSYPLAEARIELSLDPEHQGFIKSSAWLRPWLPLEEINTAECTVVWLPRRGADPLAGVAPWSAAEDSSPRAKTWWSWLLRS